VGRLLYQRLIGDAADLGYVSLFAGITLPNAASVGLHEAMGFERLGVFSKRWVQEQIVARRAVVAANAARSAGHTRGDA